MTSTPNTECTNTDYQLALDVIDERTGEDRPGVISQFDATGRLALCGVSKHVARDVLDNLVATNHLLRWERNDRRWLCRNDPEAIRRAIVFEAERDEPDQRVIGQLNKRLQEHTA